MNITIASTDGIAENKDYAREIREMLILPCLLRGEQVVLDFSGVRIATQSFVHALIAEGLQRHGELALDFIEFRNCSEQLRIIVEIVVDYSLGGFEPESGDAKAAARA